jgi:hypothetical protein
MERSGSPEFIPGGRMEAKTESELRMQLPAEFGFRFGMASSPKSIIQPLIGRNSATFNT